MQDFNEWMDDIFGFEKEQREQEKALLAKKPNQEKPIKAFNLQEMMDNLYRLSEYAVKPPFQRFFSEMQWGTEAGALRTIITPKYHVVIERLSNDLRGDPIWICKKIYSINYDDFAGKEDLVASEVYEALQMLEKEKLNMNTKEYDLATLAIRMSTSVKAFKHDVLVFQGLKKLTECNYEIYMSVKGAGVGRSVGARTSRSVQEYILDMSFNEHTGNVKVFFFPISAQDEGGNAWEVLPAEFMEFFSSSQHINEIIDAVMVSLKCF